jgi:hypothetical protein
MAVKIDISDLEVSFYASLLMTVSFIKCNHNPLSKSTDVVRLWTYIV